MSGNKNSGRKEVYPWDRWFDGQEHRLAPQSDFYCNVLTFSTLAYRAAAKRGIRATTHKDGRIVIIRAIL